MYYTTYRIWIGGRQSYWSFITHRYSVVYYLIILCKKFKFGKNAVEFIKGHGYGNHSSLKGNTLSYLYIIMYHTSYGPTTGGSQSNTLRDPLPGGDPLTPIRNVWNYRPYTKLSDSFQNLPLVHLKHCSVKTTQSCLHLLPHRRISKETGKS